MTGIVNTTGVRSGTVDSRSVTNLTGVLPVGVTGGSGLTALGTVTAGNISNSAIVYPAGHVVQNKVLLTETGSSNIQSNSGNWDSVVGGTLVTKLASTASFLKIWFATNQVNLQTAVIGGIDMTLRQSSSTTTHADGDSMHNTTNRLRIYALDNNDDGCSGSWPIAYPFYSGTQANTTAYVSNISSWSAGETLYWRLFQAMLSGSANIGTYMGNGRLEIWLEEISI